MKLNNFNSVYSLAQTLYGTILDQSDFEDIALNGWEKIGNKYSNIKRLTACTQNKKIKLPCDVDYILSVNHSFNDAQMTSSKTNLYQIDTLFTESYIERWKYTNDPSYQSGKLAKYWATNDELVFNRDYGNVSIIYYEIIKDDDGLPMLTDKETRALAVYLAYTDMYKKALANQNPNTFQMAQVLKHEWVRACAAARVPDILSMNDLNKALDAQTSWDRKVYGKSFKY